MNNSITKARFFGFRSDSELEEERARGARFRTKVQEQQHEISNLKDRVIELQKTVIAQGQKFNDQTQRIKDLEFELGKPNLVYMRLRDYINQLEGSLKVATNSLDREMIKTLLKNLEYLCLGEKSK